MYAPEAGSYLNDETMQDIRDVGATKESRCMDMSELLAI